MRRSEGGPKAAARKTLEQLNKMSFQTKIIGSKRCLERNGKNSTICFSSFFNDFLFEFNSNLGLVHRHLINGSFTVAKFVSETVSNSNMRQSLLYLPWPP
jgi:hypothetical protein